MADWRCMGEMLLREELQGFLMSIQSAFYERDLDTLFARFTLPLVVYSAAGVSLVRDEAEFERMTDDYRAALHSRAATHGALMIESQEPAVNNRLRVTVRTRDLDENETQVTGSLVRYFLFEGPEGFTVEMLEYLEVPLPLSEVEDIVH